MPDLARVPQSILDSVVVTPEENEEDIRDVAREYSERLETTLREVIDEGAVIFGKSKPANRLRAFLDLTLIQDVPLVLNPDYMKALKAGLAPLPASPMWQGLAALPDFAWHHFARDFRDLLRLHPAEAVMVTEALRLATMEGT
mgnify:CR=1 FL=1